MKKIILNLTLISICSATQADYIIKIPLENDNGGHLPNNSINITPRTPSLPNETWIPYDTEYTAWVNQDEPYNCTNWTPNESSVITGEFFTQTATDCKQNQTRLVQEREQETTTMIIRNKGISTIDSNIILVESSRQATGSMNSIYDSNNYWMSSYEPSRDINEFSVFINNESITDKDHNTTSYKFKEIQYIRGKNIMASLINIDDNRYYYMYDVCSEVF